MIPAAPDEVIELRVEDIAQLFHTLDPFPFRNRDLDKEAEDFIVGWARELPANQPIQIIVHFPKTPEQDKAASELADALTHYFAYRARGVQHDLNELFRIGRRSLLIGIPVLIGCLFLSHLAAGYLAEIPFRRLLEESFLILGWVANWRPIEIFLYDWWPLRRRRDLYRRLAAATVICKPFPPGASPFPTSLAVTGTSASKRETQP